MNIGKKLLSILLCLMLVFGTLAVGTGGFAELFDSISIKASAAYSVGDTIYYGTYPQTDVTASLGSVLNSQSGTWKSYNYYRGTDNREDGQMVPSDYMRYKDVTYNGNKYRGVAFDDDRPEYTGSSSGSGAQNLNGYSYLFGTGIFWFKYEPIKWRVLDSSSGLIMCDSIIDSQPYNNYILEMDGRLWGDSARTYYANNYAMSSIRQWLNNDFYNTAFSDEHKANIKTTLLNNDCWATLNGFENREDFDAPSTSDKIFLLSYNEVANSAYGFDSSNVVKDSARRLQGSNYAKCQGLLVYKKSGDECDGNSYWWLRTPDGDGHACAVMETGDAAYYPSVGCTAVGVVPALELQDLKSDYIDNNNIYNLGEETYSFKNYGDSDSVGGHCFGMSMTSAGYYTGKLSKSLIDLGDNQALYSLSSSAKVKKPICFYQRAQGKYSKNATVAGGKYYLTGYYNIQQDWDSVINYVKDHSYDGKGPLQIGFRKVDEGGHAINFLRYEEVNGQQRIYAYDNNFPTIETYFYQNSSGNVFQAPKQTFSGSIDCIALRNVTQYFENVVSYEENYYVYAAKDSITVSGAEVYPIETSEAPGEYVLFEIPDGTETVTITPKNSNAEFTYMDETYSFGQIDSDTYATLTLSDSDDSMLNVAFTIKNAPVSPTASAKLNAKTSTTVDYRSKVNITATASGVPDGYFLAIYSGNTLLEKGTKDKVTYTPKDSNNKPIELKSDTTYTVKVIDGKNAVQKDSNGKDLTANVEIKVKQGFFDKLIAFFKGLFGLLPTVEIKP